MKRNHIKETRKEGREGGRKEGKEGNAIKEENVYLHLNPSPFDLRQAQYRSHDMRSSAIEACERRFAAFSVVSVAERVAARVRPLQQSFRA